MNIRIESDFQFAVAAIQCTPSGELRLTLQSDAVACGGHYQYSADLGDCEPASSPVSEPA